MKKTKGCDFTMEEILLGTYTREFSKGIYKVILDKCTNQLKNLQLLIEAQNPTYLAHDEKYHLISVYGERDDGGIAAFDLVENPVLMTDKYTEKNVTPLCYVSTDSERNLLFGANYHDGSIYCYKISDNGEIQLSEKIKRTSKNNQVSHIHYADLTPDQRLIVCDLGTDEILLFNISDLGKLELLTTFQLPKGVGPRHLVFNPNNNELVYIFCELSNQIFTLKYDSDNAQFEQLTVVSSLEQSDQQAAGGAAIKISQDGKFLYTSTRSNNSINVFEIKDEKLNPIQHISTEGDGPRDFTLAGQEEYLIVGHQYSNNLTLFKRDSKNGTLTLIQKDFEAPEVVCLLPLDN